MSEPVFTNLHVHTEHGSLLDGIIRINDLPKRVSELGMNAVAITDHGFLHGVINFWKACKAAGVKPILGCEIYCTDDKDGLPKEERKRDNYHLTLLATNLVGYKNLLKLCSNAALNNFYYKPRVSKQMLQQYNQGLIALSGCLGSELATKRDYEVIEWHKNIFGDRYYLEVQDPDGDQAQIEYNDWLIRWNKAAKVPLVITADAHFLEEVDFPVHEVIMCIQLKKNLAEYRASDDMRFSKTKSIRPPADMLAAAVSHTGSKDAYYNAGLINERCEEYNPGLGKNRFPYFDITMEPDYQEFLVWQASR